MFKAPLPINQSDNGYVIDSINNLQNSLTGGSATVTVSGDTGAMQTMFQFSAGSTDISYSAGQCVGGNGEATGLLNSGKGAIIGSISTVVNDPAAQKPAYYLHCFSKPLNSTYIDGGNLSISAQDRANYVSFVSIPSSSWAKQGGTTSTNYVAWNSNLAALYMNSVDNNFYYLLEAQSNFNASGGTPIFSVHFLKN